MKIVATITNYAACVHIGGPIEAESCIIEIPDESIPSAMKRHRDYMKSCIDSKKAAYESVSFSLFSED